MFKFITVSILSFLSLELFATEQVKDLLIINKDTFYIESPIDSTDSKFNDNWYKKFGMNCFNTSCWRGAICVWTIKHDSIFLTKIISCCDGKEIDLNKVGKTNDKIFAKWLNGTFDFPSGKRLTENIFWLPSFDNSFSIFEYDNLLVIKKGKVIINKRFDNKNGRTGKFKNEESLFEEINRCLVGNVETRQNQNIEFDMTFNSDEKGRMDNIEIFGIKDSLTIKDIKRALKDVDGLPLFYRFGKRLEYKFEGRFEMCK